MSNDTLDWNNLDRLFDAMGQEKDRSISQFWDWCRAGDQLAQNTGLMVVQLKPDFEQDMLMLGGTLRKARTVSRHVTKIAEAFTTIRGEFQKIPATIMKTYAEELSAARRPGNGRRQPINLKK